MFKNRKKDDNGYRKEPYETKYGYQGKPDGDNAPNTLLSQKAMKDLPHSSYALKADPYEAALPTGEPYAILNKFNRVVGGKYGGEQNIDGGNVQQYANSTTSNFRQIFDEMRIKIGVNYRYLPILPQLNDKYAGYALIDEMRKSIAESVSILKATTFTQMAINNFAIETDLPMGSAEKNENGFYTDMTDVIYGMSIYYQLFLQEGLSTMNWHNSFRMKQGTAIRNAWDREVPILNSFFGLMNKSSFLSMLNSINLSFEGEYVDKEFMEQINTLTMVPSRRSNSMTDPVLEMQVYFHRPNVFRVHLLDENNESIAVLYDDASLSYDNGDGPISYWEACDQIKNYLSLEATQNWARKMYKSGNVVETDNARFNTIKSYFDVINAAFTKFKPLWADYREALDVMVRTGTISWTKGFKPGIVKATDVQLFWNVMVDHIYQMLFSGADKLNYDDATKRWRTYSLWNMYSGTPEYDKFSGGAFLTFSFKQFEGNASTFEQYEFLPLIFAPAVQDDKSVICVACSRDGYEAVIKQESIKIRDNKVLARIAPLASQENLTIRIPTLDLSDEVNAELTNFHQSHLYKMMTQIFGTCCIKDEEMTDYSIDPDILAIYQIEISDITNIAITYARANAPFRGTTSTSGNLLGFTRF